MPIFETADELYTCIGGLLERMKSQSETQGLFEALELTLRFSFTDPEATITLMSRDGEQTIAYGECEHDPDVGLAMTGDIAHQFWSGEIKVMGAIAKRRIVPTGSLSKIMMLTPLLKAAMRLYPEHYEQWLRDVKR